MSTEGLERAYATTRGVFATVTPAQLDAASPCASWRVRNVISHIIGAGSWFADTMNSGVAPIVDPNDQPDLTGGDYMREFDRSSEAAIAAFGAPGALEKSVKLPFGDFPGAMFLGLATNDVFQHGWDVAKATGQSTDLDPEQAEQLLAMVRMGIPESFRGPDTVAPFGPEQTAPTGAPAADQLAAFLGRRV